MSAKILHKPKFGNQLVWSLCGYDFSKDGIHFKVIGSESTGSGIYEVTHTIKNLKTGTYAYIPMPKLIEILQSCE